MMVALLVYAYCVASHRPDALSVRPTRTLGFACSLATSTPTTTSIASFRKQHLEALAGLFLQVLRLCQKAGLAKLGHIAIDGTKLKANASKHKAMSYERMGVAEKKLEEEVHKPRSGRAHRR
ncbi:MAG: hypothetical protein IPF92_24590 [Myxococcales bacterium]|nr:hypothetical protein [Myxococcales bacterium]